MVTELRLYNLGNLLRVGQVECHVGKCWIQHTSTDIIHLSTHTGRTRVFTIQTGQGCESSLTLVHTVGEVTQLVLDTIDFLHRNTRLHGENLHLHLSWHERNAVSWQVVEILAHLGRRYLDILHQFLLHLLDELLVLEVVVHLLAHLGDALLAILLQFLTGTNHGNPVINLVVDALHHLRFRDLDTVDGCLMQKELLHRKLFRDRTVWVASILDSLCFSLKSSHLDIRLQDSFIADYPNHFVNDAAWGHILRVVHRLLLARISFGSRGMAAHPHT